PRRVQQGGARPNGGRAGREPCQNTSMSPPMPRPGSAALPGRAPSLGRDVIERDATLLSDAPAPVSSNRRGTGIPSRMRREKSGSWSAAWARASIRLAALTHRCSAPIHAHDAAVRAHRGELYPRQSPSRSRRRAAIASSREHWAQLRARSHGGDREGHPACDQRAAQVSRSGAEGSRTPDLYSASVALSQLSYGPTGGNPSGVARIARRRQQVNQILAAALKVSPPRARRPSSREFGRRAGLAPRRAGWPSPRG